MIDLFVRRKFTTAIKGSEVIVVDLTQEDLFGRVERLEFGVAVSVGSGAGKAYEVKNQK